MNSIPYAGQPLNCESKGRGSIMPLISLVLTLIVVGVLLWAANQYIPMDAKIKQILNIVVVIVVVLWLLQIFGLLEAARGIRVGPLR